MAKKLMIILLFIVLFLAIILGCFYYYITSSHTATALLDIKQGQVQIDQGEGWVEAVDEMTLSLDDKIRTLGAGKASVILYESAIINLEPNSEILLENINKENLKIKLESGRTKNKFTGLQGVKGLSIETPNFVANVRGTSFEVSLNSIIVAEGKVEVIQNNKKIIINQGEKVEITKDQITKKTLTENDKDNLIQILKENVNNLKKMRMREVNKKRILAEQLKKKYDLTDEIIKEKLAEADQGLYDLDDIEEKSPVKIEAVKKIKSLTEQIIKENKEIEKLMKLHRLN